MGARSRRKGAAWEREIAIRLNDARIPGWDTRRGLGQTRSGAEVCDVEGSPFWIECKCGRRPNIYAALAQAEEARDERAPVVVARKNSAGGGAPSVDTVTMRLEDWIDLVKRATS